MKHQDSITTVRRLVAFYVDEHNRVLPHSAFRGQTPDEMYFGTGDAILADLTSCAVSARRARLEANRSASCATHARQSTRPRDHRSDHTRRGPVRPAAKPEPATAPRTSRWAEPCPGSRSRPIASPCRLNDENSRLKVQNVCGDSSVGRRSPSRSALSNRISTSNGLRDRLVAAGQPEDLIHGTAVKDHCWFGPPQ